MQFILYREETFLRILVSSFEVKKQLFQIYHGSFYCYHLWSNYSTESCRRLKIDYIIIYRMFMKLEYRISMSHTFIQHVLQSDVIICKSMCGFRTRVKASNVSKLREVLDTVNCKTRSFQLLVVLCTMSTVFQYWSKNVFLVSM